jgi:hypothetical protein
VNLFGFIDAERAYLSVALLCRMLGVSRSGYSTPGDPRDPSKEQADLRICEGSCRVESARGPLWTQTG